MQRRNFLKAVGGGSLLAAAGCASPAGSQGSGERPDAELNELAELALGVAEAGGASYSDCRIHNVRRQSLAAREERISRMQEAEESGFGVRVLVEGTWGFAASSDLSRSSIVRVAKRAVALARANAAMQTEPVVLAPNPAHVAVWRAPVRRDPFAVSAEEKVARLLEINTAALEQEGINFCRSSMDFVGEHKFFASSDGARIEQHLRRSNPSFRMTAVDPAGGGFLSRNSYASPQGLGYEYVEDYPWLADVAQAAEDLREMQKAPSIEPGKYDLILHPSNLWLTIHESIGHPTEFDRAILMEANYAGTSFLTPEKRGKMRVGSPIVHFDAEKTSPGALATSAYDDDGVATERWPLIERGIFKDYQTTRDQAHLLGQAASHGCSNAQSWWAVPFQRMPNVNLRPGPEPLSYNDLIGDTKNGIVIYGRGSYSIDHQRYNFQFGGQTYRRVKNGRVVGMLRDLAYQSRTPDFWQACDAICDASEYRVNGSFYDGKGEPGQVNAVSHGCSPARFRGIDVIHTGA